MNRNGNDSEGNDTPFSRDADDDLAQLQGTWKIIKVTHKGSDITPFARDRLGDLLIISQRSWIIPEHGRKPAREVTIDVVASHTPKYLLYLGHSEMGNAIYDVKDDLLTVANCKEYHPANFDTPPDEDKVVFVYMQVSGRCDKVVQNKGPGHVPVSQ